MIDLSLWAQVVVFLIVAGVFFASGQASIFHPAAWYIGFHFVVFVLRPILVHTFDLRLEWDYMMFKPTEAVFIKTLAVSSGGLIVFVAACLVAGWTKPRFANAIRPSLTSLQRRGLLFTTLILLPLVAWSIYATREGVKRELSGGIYILTDSTGYLNQAQDVLLPLLCIWLMIARFRWHMMLPVALYLAYRSWFGWGRWSILLFLAMAITTYCWYCRKKWLPLWTILVAVPVLLLFNVLGHNRELIKSYFEGKPAQVYEFEPGITAQAKRKLKYDGPDFANFDFLAYIIAVVPERTDNFSYGLQHLQIFTEPIPRMLWSGKPKGAPVQTINPFQWGNFLGLTISLAGDGWLSGGWAGLVLTCGISGAVLGLCHRRFWKACDRPFFALLYIGGVAMLPQLYRDGSYVSLAKFLLFTWLPFLLWAGFNWLLQHRQVPVRTYQLSPGSRITLIANHGSPVLTGAETERGLRRRQET